MDIVSWGFVAVGVMYVVAFLIRSSPRYAKYLEEHNKRFPPYRYWEEDKK